jgi:predicted secreted protein
MRAGWTGPGRRAASHSALLLALLLPLAGHAETLLQLSETASIPAHPDELDATLRAEATGPTAQDVQSRVNAAIADALAQARSVQGVQVSTGYYNVFHQQQPRNQWQGVQSLELRSHDGSALLDLVGALQGKGMVVAGLDWRLSDELGRSTREAATRQAVSHLQARAEEMAGLLGLRFDSFRTVRLDADRPPPFPGPRLLAAAAPSAEAADITISATVSADVVLQPK